MGFIQSLFGGKESQFQKTVLEILKPGHAALQAGRTPLQIRLNGIEMDLTDLFARCQQNQVQTTELIQQYFSYPLAMIRSGEYSWSQAEPLVRPQLVSSDLAARMDVVAFPFADSISAVVVIKDGLEQIFVHSSDAEKWSVPRQQLYDRAIANLSTDPFEKEVTITDGTDRFIGLESHDGFDAVRVLLPSIREFAANKLGEPCWAGIPNRDFLILWSRECSVRFQEYAMEKIETDFSIQSYPLTKTRFELSGSQIKSDPV